MAFKLKYPSVRCRVEWMPKTASVAIGDGAVVYTTSGAVSALSAASDERIAGVAMRAVTSADSDYATAGAKIPVLIDEDGIWEASLSSSTNTIANGAALDFNDSVSVHVSNSTYDQCIAVNPSGATNRSKMLFKLIRWEGEEPAATN